MSIGTGIFLSAIFLGIVALFICTRDSWKWKRAIWWTLGTIFALCAVVAVGIYGYLIWEDRPKVEQQFWGIRVGSTMADVKFAKGLPTRVPKPEVWVFDLENADNGFYIVRFLNGKVRYVMYDGRRFNAPAIQGINGFASPDDVIRKFGPPSYISKSNDELKRTYSFTKFNVAFNFERNEVTALGIFDPSSGPLQFVEEAK